MIKELLYFAIVLSLTVFLLIYAFAKWRFRYWKSRKIACIEPQFPFGNLTDVALKKCHITEQFGRIYVKLKQKNTYHGGLFMFLKPVYMPIAPELIKHILIKDFNQFINRGMTVNADIDPLSYHIGYMESTAWRNLRSKLSPCFNSNKLKLMFDIVNKCAAGLCERIEEQHKNSTPFNVGDLMARYTIDVVCSTAYGVDCNSLADPDTILKRKGQQIFPTNTLDVIKLFSTVFLPKWLYKMLRIRLIDLDIEEFFIDLVTQTIEYRERNNVQRNDLMQSLIQIWKDNGEESILKSPNKEKKIKEIAAQALIFFAGGFETSSTALTFAFYELAKNPEIQQKVRLEIFETLAKHNNEVTYESINEMSSLEMVILETLRLYPSAFIIRQALNDYKVPNTDFVLEKGSQVIIPMLGIQRDSEYYPDPEIFDPERFTEENKKSRPHCTFLAYGDGPRSCIAYKFGEMQVKIGIVSLLRNFEFEIDSKTQQPIKLNEDEFFTAPKGGVWLRAKKID